MNLQLENILNLIPTFGVILILCGLIKIYTYYKYFHIFILPYLRASEVLILFMENLFGFLLVTLFVTYISLDFYHEIEIDGKGFQEALKTNALERLGYYLQEIWLGFIALGLSILSFFIYYKVRERVKGHEFLLSIPLFAFGYIFTPILPVLTKELVYQWYEYEVPILYIYFVFLILSLITFSVVSAINEAYKVQKHRYYLNTVFIFDDNESIISTEHIYYVGKTKDFLFYFNEKNKTPVIVPSIRLKKMYTQ